MFRRNFGPQDRRTGSTDFHGYITNPVTLTKTKPDEALLNRVHGYISMDRKGFRFDLPKISQVTVQEAPARWDKWTQMLYELTKK